ncbi:butyrophilin subfamily 3 member A1-like [Brienomyrus brachyistius]|uniref:butyrophilin subfamily 3 member A1-like n=1 Tax=Brienomyrus brachyistius TaxID=42636 RepID=UPI0020B25161|nr:butyrophilin subfamily 3 member A1-like [Brienomyrus brachyistius]
MEDKWSSCSCFILLLFQHVSVSRPENYEVLGPSDPVVVAAGEDVVLPCFLKPNISAVDLEVRWFRKDFTEYVYLYQNAKNISTNQIPSYKDRASLFPDELKKGNVSLKLKGVQSSDSGRYKCFVQSPESHDDWSINVIIMGTQSVISIERDGGRGISFMYELKSWYPDAEVTWLDSEGQNLKTEYSETHRSGDGSLSLRGRVIVQERDNNRFTSRVLQKQLGLLREEVVEISGEMFHHAYPWKVAFWCLLSAFALTVMAFLISCKKMKRKNAQLQETRARLNTTKARLSTMEARLSTSEVQLWQTEARFSTTEVQLRQTEARLSTTEAQLRQTEARLTDKEAQLSQMQDHISKILDFEVNLKNAVDVTLDPDTAKPELIISENGKEVTYRGNNQNLSSNPLGLNDFGFYDLRFDLYRLGVLGKEGFTSGRHYWEVMVGKKTEWALGVVGVTDGKEYESSWGIGLSQGRYQAFSKHCMNLYVNKEPEKVGIFVDYGERQVSFYNVGAKSYIYSFFDLEFKEELYPFFIPPLKRDEDNLAPLIITPVQDPE